MRREKLSRYHHPEDEGRQHPWNVGELPAYCTARRFRHIYTLADLGNWNITGTLNVHSDWLLPSWSEDPLLLLTANNCPTYSNLFQSSDTRRMKDYSRRMKISSQASGNLKNQHQVRLWTQKHTPKHAAHCARFSGNDNIRVHLMTVIKYVITHSPQ
jgi:hypothetical protein